MEKNKIYLLNVVIARTSFAQNTDYQKITDVSSYSKSDQRNLEKKRSKEQKELADRVSLREFLGNLVSTLLFGD